MGIVWVSRDFKYLGSLGMSYSRYVSSKKPNHELKIHGYINGSEYKVEHIGKDLYHKLYGFFTVDEPDGSHTCELSTPS